MVPAAKLDLGPIEPGGLLKATVEVLIDELDLQLDSQEQVTLECSGRGTVTLSAGTDH